MQPRTPRSYILRAPPKKRKRTQQTRNAAPQVAVTTKNTNATAIYPRPLLPISHQGAHENRHPSNSDREHRASRSQNALFLSSLCPLLFQPPARSREKIHLAKNQLLKKRSPERSGPSLAPPVCASSILFAAHNRPQLVDATNTIPSEDTSRAAMTSVNCRVATINRTSQVDIHETDEEYRTPKSMRTTNGGPKAAGGKGKRGKEREGAGRGEM